jgi:hypothetical protein
MTRVRSIKKKVLTVLAILLVLGIVLQFFRPAPDNPPVTAEWVAPPEVKAIFQRACYDCHSNQTRLAWFDQPAPAYWLVVSDVNKGRAVLNFSTFDSLPKAQQAAKLYEALNQIEFHTMPLSSYALLHHWATLSPDDITTLRQYLLNLAPKAVPDTAKLRLTLAQFAQWTAAGPAATNAARADAPNGIAFLDLADFANWKAMSTTERFDNGTMRLILANVIAERAIHDGHTHPWPKGATFAKVAWDQLPDSAGEIHTGAFRQVEFMIRDQDKYAATDGWGFARWVGGLALKPYGKDPGFVNECTDCHQTMAADDHVFTFPLADTLALYDQSASLPDSIAGHPMTGRAITAFVNRRDQAMSTLYGNDIGVKSARSGQAVYPAGSVLALVTWSQRDDPHWFGGRIPRMFQSVEVLTFGQGATPSYERYEGKPLAKKQPAAADVPGRIAYITAQKAAVLP